MMKLFQFLLFQWLWSYVNCVVKFVTQSVAGYNAILSASADGGTTFSVLGELTDFTVQQDTKMMDATSHSSGGFEEVIPGNTKWTATAKLLSVAADAGQVILTTALAGKTKLVYRFDIYGTAVGKPRRQGSGYITSWKETAATTNPVLADVSFDGTGQLVLSTQ